MPRTLATRVNGQPFRRWRGCAERRRAEPMPSRRRGRTRDSTEARRDGALETRAIRKPLHGRPEMNTHHATVVDLSKRKLLAVAHPTGRRTLSNRAGYWLAASVVGLGLYASLTPSPLYRS